MVLRIFKKDLKPKYLSLKWEKMSVKNNKKPKTQEKKKGKKTFDVLGNIALVKFSEDTKEKDKKKYAEEVLEENKQIKTVVEKTGKIKGRLRKPETKHLAGEKNKEVLYKENGCVFRFNIDTTYFSPRLAGERKELAGRIKSQERVLVMFAGVGPYTCVIAKNSPAGKVYSNEINREANKYAKQNVERNKLQSKVEFVNGDIKKVTKNLKNKNPEGFDVIVMPRPQLEDTFIKQALMLSKKTTFFSRILGKKPTRIYYYGFCHIDNFQDLIEGLKKEAKKEGRKIKVLNKKLAGDIAPYRYRVRVDFVVY